MNIQLLHNGNSYEVNLNEPYDISIPLRNSTDNVNAWYAPPPVFEPVRYGNWVGSVESGASVNFRNILFNPHAHGTHTECAGHISKEVFSVNNSLKCFHFVALLTTVSPTEINDDLVITKEAFINLSEWNEFEAIIIRTLPNNNSKLSKHYSNTNPPYIHHDAIKFLNGKGIKHLLIDLPSVDKEKDDGLLLSHKEFWFGNQTANLEKTITEMVYIPNEVTDGLYLLNLMIAPFENDASPSKPVIYKMKQV